MRKRKQPLAWDEQEEKPSDARDGSYTRMGEAERERAWELHLRGWAKSRIARELGRDPETITRAVAACYREVGADHRAEAGEKLRAAVERLRLVQRQAWADHDSDDERERLVLEAALAEVRAESAEGAAAAGGGGKASVKYQSQRSQYLRVILDAEREIARLNGLYEGLIGDGSAVTVIIRDDAGQPVSLFGAAKSRTGPAALPAPVEGEA